jgi:hypothetical protein
VLIEKFLFILIDDPMLIEESLEGRVSIIKRVLLVQKFIVVGSFVPVREDLKGFSYFLKPCFCCFSVFLMLVRVPFGGQFLVGVLDFKEGGTFRDAKDSIIVL